MKTLTRRQMLGAAAAAAPMILPSRVFGRPGPNDLIRVAQIGCGRIARSSEMPGMLRHRDLCRIVAVCDVDSLRAVDAQKIVQDAYKDGTSIKACTDYRELLADKSIDAVLISTPDHWHAQAGIEFANAGKDLYVQKPLTLTQREGRQLCDVVKQTGRVFQTGTQQRSEVQFRTACELVRNGRIGKLREIYIGLPLGPRGGDSREMPIPRTLDYDRWLGWTPQVPYTETRVHPQSDDQDIRYGPVGWMRIDNTCCGMITDWGVHHVDIAQWAMGVEKSGPVEIAGSGEYGPPGELWNVHRAYHVRYKYANGVTVYASDKYPNGLRFIGDEGWIFVTRGTVRPSIWEDPKRRSGVFDASDLRILREGTRSTDMHLHASPSDDHHLDWLTAIRSRKETVAPAEDGHRSTSTSILGYISMKLNRTLKWDAAQERFENDDEANAMLARKQRAGYGTDTVIRK